MSDKIKREVKHQKDEIFETYVSVLVFMMENRDKSFKKSEIGGFIFGEGYQSTEKNMVSRCVNKLIDTDILRLVTETTDDNGKSVELPSNQSRVRLYDRDLDDKDDTEFGVDFHIPKTKDGKINLSNTISSIVKGDPFPSIYSVSIKTVLESQLFGFNTDFVSQTISKSILRQQNINNQYNETIGMYPIDIILSIIKSQINVNVTFENFGNTIQLNNTKIKRISIKENGFDIHFDNFISQNQSDLNQIKLIENTSEDGLRSDVDKLKELSETIDDETIKEVIKKITTFEEGVDVFEF